jgi:hypothetical protein
MLLIASTPPVVTKSTSLKWNGIDLQFCTAAPGLVGL